jgi:hypothetical protein
MSEAVALNADKDWLYDNRNTFAKSDSPCSTVYQMIVIIYVRLFERSLSSEAWHVCLNVEQEDTPHLPSMDPGLKGFKGSHPRQVGSQSYIGTRQFWVKLIYSFVVWASYIGPVNTKFGGFPRNYRGYRYDR